MDPTLISDSNSSRTLLPQCKGQVPDVLKRNPPKLLFAPVTKIHINYLSYINISTPSDHLPNSYSRSPIIQRNSRNRNLSHRSPLFKDSTRNYQIKEGLQKRNLVTAQIAQKRDINEELLEGIDLEMKAVGKKSSRKACRLKFMPANQRKKMVSAQSRVSVFDDTVPDAMVIVSKTPMGFHN
jgi:hypothetical protein